MEIVDGSTVLTKTDRDHIVWMSIRTLTWKDDSLTSNTDLMDESLSLECIDDAVECREIHTRGSSFWLDELLFEI